MERELEGKVAIVTGASSGIGAATAVKMAGAGAKVVAAARRKAEGEAVFSQADVSREDDIRRLVDETAGMFGRLDCAFNNAGSAGRSPQQWHERSVEVFDETDALNLRGVWLLMRHQLARMVEQESGVIVNNSSIAGITAGPGEIYTATKHGVVGLGRTAAQNYGRHGIRVVTICPGIIETPMVASVPGETRERIDGRIALGRAGTPDEIAEIVVFLCSERAAYISGTEIVADGGLSGSGMRF